jgi:hypothetical protein
VALQPARTTMKPGRPRLHAEPQASQRTRVRARVRA